MNNTSKVMKAMVGYYANDVRRINHFMKVYGFAKFIGELEGLDEKQQEILEIAGLTHDIGIKISEKKYNSAGGNYQQMEGPREGEILLNSLDIPKDIIARVCWLIGHHHTYYNIQDLDHQILIEADFLVNAGEDQMSKRVITIFRDNIFRTIAGIEMLNDLYEV